MISLVMCTVMSRIVLVFLSSFIREDLIETHIESAVDSMQSVIELGRLIRERNTMPLRVCIVFSSHKQLMKDRWICVSTQVPAPD